MKTLMKIVLITSIILISVGIFGSIDKKNNDEFNNKNSYFNGMMYGRNSNNNIPSDEKISLDKLKNQVNEYIKVFTEKLVISDIFIFEDSDYYFSIMEEETGIGTMELLVDPYTGIVYQEFGPNMMWNLKYGMHHNSYGMKGNRGMMRGNYYKNELLDDKYLKRNEILIDDAKDIAKKYIEKETSSKYTISQDGHEFYGYYTFHIEMDVATEGMLSVNGFTGRVWVHNWHGTVAQVIDAHES